MMPTLGGDGHRQEVPLFALQQAPRGTQRGQATVEMAVILPVVVMLLLLTVQVGLVARDRVMVVNAARVAARTAAVDPTVAAVTGSLVRLGPPVDRAQVVLGADIAPGAMLPVTVRMRPTSMPLIGRLLGDRWISERLVVLVEGAEP
jgi:hypothetical protein